MRPQGKEYVAMTTLGIGIGRKNQSELDAVTAPEFLSGLPRRIHEIYEPFVRSMPDHLALIGESQTLTYGQFASAVDTVASELKSLGVEPGDRVMIASENSVELATVVFALSKLDAWTIVVNPRLSARELDQIAEHAGPRRQLFMAGVSQEAAMHAERLGAAVGDFGPFKKIGVGAHNSAPVAEPVEQDPARQVAVLIYTSGTTGVPKGVMLTHQNLLFSAKVSGLLREMATGDAVYGVLPMSHIVGLSIILVSTLMFGGTIITVPKFDPVQAAQAIADGAVTILYGVPATYQRMLACKQSCAPDLARGRLRLAGVAGAPLDLTLKRRFEEDYGLPLLNGYGITECSPGISGVRQEDPCQDDSVGKILPAVETRIVKTDGRVAPAGETGELQVRGPNVMLGYYRAPDLTRAVVDLDGWFSTGDLARFDGDWLYIVGRVKEMIIRSGFNVYPAEIEAVINEDSRVLQSAVVGRAVEGNEEVIAFVQSVPGSKVSLEDLEGIISSRLAPYKRPSKIVVLDAFPVGSTGKILKNQLKERARDL